VGISRLIINKNIAKEFSKLLISKIEKINRNKKFFIQQPANKQQRKKILKLIRFIETNIGFLFVS